MSDCCEGGDGIEICEEDTIMRITTGEKFKAGKIKKRR